MDVYNMIFIIYIEYIISNSNMKNQYSTPAHCHPPHFQVDAEMMICAEVRQVGGRPGSNPKINKN